MGTTRSGEYRIESGGVRMDMKFPTEEAARYWARRNSKGKGNYEIVEVRAPRLCNCQEMKKLRLWSCPVHGNLWSGER